MGRGRGRERKGGGKLRIRKGKGGRELEEREGKERRDENGRGRREREGDKGKESGMASKHLKLREKNQRASHIDKNVHKKRRVRV